MAETRNAPTTPPAAGWPVGAAGIAAAAGVLHLAFVGRYGYFRDEFYYLACGRRLDWGYVDHPPFVALVARFAHGLFGDSFLAIRILPILAGSLTILLTGLLARELGGGRYAQTLAALCAAVAPHYLFVFHILSMNAFEVLLWTAAALIAARLLNGGDPRLWLLFGALCGVGLENKHSMAFFGIGVFVGLLLGRRWEALRNPWLWLGGLLAGLLFLPNLLWEVRHGWPTLEFARNAQAVKIVALTPLQFLGQQVMLLHPFTAPVWIAGLGFLLLAPAGRRWRPLGWAYLVVLGIFLAQTAKAYYLTPYATILFAAGAVAAGRLAERRG
ncbi:MAG TPA: glycosyltransferase family 39 protein, partial [Thermoanaerobaculia bacterium]|nr:glycosyltransferase family 39 protein [Thermoanaerobaculia bacterium]